MVECGVFYVTLAAEIIFIYVRMRFLGNIEAKTDAKGRVFLPAAFRKELKAQKDDRLIMRKDIYQQCLVLYPEPVWNVQLDALRSRMNGWDSRHRTIFRQFVSEAEEVTLDGNGRLLIPKRHMQFAGIEQAVRFIGMDDTIEIWSAENAGSPFMDTLEFSRGIEEIMSGTHDTHEEL